MSSLTMAVRCTETSMGESVAIVGSWSNWKIPTVMTTTAADFPLWSASININVCKGGEYKYVIIRDGRVGRWEEGDNRQVEARFIMVDDGAFGDGGSNRKQLKSQVAPNPSTTPPSAANGVAKPTTTTTTPPPANGVAKTSTTTSPTTPPAANGVAKPKDAANGTPKSAPANGVAKMKESTPKSKTIEAKETPKKKTPVEKENKAPISISSSPVSETPPAPKDIAGDTLTKTCPKVAAVAEKVQGDTLTDSAVNNKAPISAATTTTTATGTKSGKRKSKSKK